MKNLLKKLLPPFLLNVYYKTWAILANLIYSFPSRKLIVIGVTGTDGKTTVVHLIAKVLEEAGAKIGAVSTVMFKVAGKEWLNKTRLTMLGRLGLQKFLRRLIRTGCQYVVIETSSEGILQFRHWGIRYDVAVFTNLTPEHIEAHGGFEKYKEAKGKLFASLSQGKKKKFNRVVQKISVVNLDDEQADYFLSFPVDEKWGYGIKSQKSKVKSQKFKTIIADDIKLKSTGTNFRINETAIDLKLLGQFNVYNALAAISVGLSQGLELKIIKNALEKFKGVPGRLEKIDEGQSFKVLVDYAHTPGSFEKLFKTLRKFWPETRFISVFGSAGGVRDVAKRPKLGKIADQYSHYLILTNEDPYDTPPMQILKDIASGINQRLKKEGEDFWLIPDRREAIAKAFSLARAEDIVLILGKGTEPCIKIGHKKIPWDDREVAKEQLRGQQKR